ncbi:MAG: hypothetical protein HY360_13490 [Verrucomicrobia bacterium]|nr:hypothetical protein [Verrucomicrobiota bacterium]
MNNRVRQFSPLQAQELAQAFNREGVEYLFIGKSGAIILGFPSTTQDVDVFVPKSRANADRIIDALEFLGFELDRSLREAIREGKDFVQIKSGPFDVDLVHAPDGIRDFASAKARSVQHEIFPVANLRDIIASKRASGRVKDLNDLPLLEAFREEYEKVHAKPLRSRREKFGK